MSRVYVVDSRGLVIYMGDEANPKVARLMEGGNSVVRAHEHPRPSDLHAWDGTRWAESAELLEALKARALASVDAQAEATRQQWITPGAGMALTYEAKRTEAVKILSDPALALANYPLAAARAARLGQTLVQVAQEWKARADLWMAKAAEIENAREAAKEAIQVAGTKAEVEAILAGLTWATQV